MHVSPDDQPEHLVADLHELLVEALGELGVRASLNGRHVFLEGTVATEERRRAVAALVAAELPDAQVHDRLQILDRTLAPPDDAERLP